MHQDDSLTRLRHPSNPPAKPDAASQPLAAPESPAPVDTGSERPDPPPADAPEHSEPDAAEHNKPDAAEHDEVDAPERNESPAQAADLPQAPTANREAPSPATAGDRPAADSTLPAPVQAERPIHDQADTAATASDQVPATLRDRMLQDPVFTRLGWGTDEPTNPEHPEAEADDPTPTSATEAPDHADVPSTDRTSHLTELVAEHDRTWDTAQAALPPGPLPESTKSLTPDVINAMNPDVRRILEYQGATEYIAANKADRPWLELAADASQQVQRIYTAIDQGNGHAHIRHGPMGNDQLYADRVARLEDPAQTDPQKRALGIDGLNDAKQHYCAKESTRIHDLEAFVAAYAGAVKHPAVQKALGTPWEEDREPRPVAIPIANLLGAHGHEACSGYQLAGDQSEAKKARKDWARARAEGQDMTNIPEPKAERIPSFEGGMIVVRFAGNSAEKRYEIITLFPKPLVES
ncbi:hypothetical protein [Kribbella sp.]|uniref:hypothetical protein n=1 Tax=Kribbella sp. TaxID=1871183 RepID=UPI002D2BFE11|nr:hypothetical protein [Kribbella sp.]HZX04028.1 hypothetical protein [Kribbella sp.]